MILTLTSCSQNGMFISNRSIHPLFLLTQAQRGNLSKHVSESKFEAHIMRKLQESGRPVFIIFFLQGREIDLEQGKGRLNGLALPREMQQMRQNNTVLITASL